MVSNKIRGFTLVELLTVVTILVVLGVGLLTMINPMTQLLKGYDAVRKADLQALKKAFEEYYEDNGCYPSQVLTALPPDRNGNIHYTYTCGSNVLSPYLNSMPCDPNTDTPYDIFFYPSGAECADTYMIYSTLANALDPDGQDLPLCTRTYSVYSPGLSRGVLLAGCSGQVICPRLYGCVSGSCTLIAEDSYPLCFPSYCDDPNCNGVCSNPSYECVGN